MRAWRYLEAGHIEIVDVEEPTIEGADDVIVEIGHVGLCLSDKHCYDGYWSLPRGLIVGHEAAGIVVGSGSNVSGLRVGDRVAVDPKLSCGNCYYCRMGFTKHCEATVKSCGGPVGVGGIGGGTIGFGAAYPDGSLIPGFLAEYCRVSSSNCYLLGDNVDTSHGALAEPLGVGVRAARLSQAKPGDAIGILGFCDYSLALMQQFPRCETVVIDPVPLRRRISETYGALLAMDCQPGEQDHVVETVYSLYPRGLDAVFVSIESYIPGSEQFMALASRLVKVAGSVQLIRVCRPEIDDSLGRSNPTFRKEVSILNSGQYQIMESLTGGSIVGEFGVAVRQLNLGLLRGDYATRHVDFGSLNDPAEIGALFAAMPESEYKIVVDVRA